MTDPPGDASTESAFSHEPGDAALILEPEANRQWTEIGRVLAYHLGLHPTDAIARARYGGGVLLSEISAAQAESLAARLGEIGIKSRVIEARLLADLPRGRRARAVALEGERLTARLFAGGELEVPADRLHAVHLYALADPAARKRAPSEEEPRRRLNARGGEEPSLLLQANWFRRHHHDLGEEVELGPRARKLRETLAAAGSPPPRLHLTLLCGLEVGPLRLRHDEIDYTTLGWEKLSNSLDNFLLLLEKLRAFAPRAWFGDRMDAFLQRLDPADILYFKPEEGQNLERWVQLWIRISEANQ